MQTENAADVDEGHPVLRVPVGVGELVDGRYRLNARLGAGGAGVVYDATDVRTGEDVALKLLHPDPAMPDAAVARFAREAEVAGSLGHPNAVAVLEAGTFSDGSPFLVMERLVGAPLSDILDDAIELSPARAAALVAQAASALDALHDAGLVHRDVKPENLFLTEGGTLKLLDFGLAAYAGNRHRLTDGAALNGTPEYMPPEVFDYGAPAAAADVYGLAVVAFEMVSGDIPFRRSTPLGLLLAKRSSRAPLLSEVSHQAVPAGFERAVARSLSRDPTRRHPSAGAFARDLRASLDDAPATGADALGPDTLGLAAVPLGARLSAAARRWAMASLGGVLATLLLGWILTRVFAPS